MKFDPTITNTLTIDDELVTAHLDKNNQFIWESANIKGDFIIGLCHSYFPIVGSYRFSHNTDTLDAINELIKAYEDVKPSKPWAMVKRGTQLDVFSFDKGIFAYVMLKLN